MSQPSHQFSGYPSPGEVIDGKYQIERMLGEGGMGAVARAIHLLRRAPVALKFMSPQFVAFSGAVDRFLNEGIAASRIESDHVVRVFDVGKLPSGAPYLVMECLDGHDLSDLLRDEGTPGLPIGRAVHFTLQILRGLQVAHASGIIHRDMKPSNCFVVNKDGEADFVKLLDFGISKVKEPGGASLTQTNSALGTPLYMSPEQARSPRDVDARSDLYSVGVILYELLTGHTPFFSESGEFTEILFKLFTAEPPPVQSTRPEIPDALAAAVHKALGRELPDRVASVIEMAESLAPFAGPESDTTLLRIRQFSPERHRSHVPAAAIPASALAFSALEAQPARQSVGPPPEIDTRARPEEAGAHTEIDSRPRMPSGPDLPPLAQLRQVPLGAHTDLVASRDMSPAPAASIPPPEVTQKRRSAAIFAVPAVALVLVAGSAIAAKTLLFSGKAPPPPQHGIVISATLPVPSDSPPAVSIASVPSPAPSLLVASATEAGAPAASASATKNPPRPYVAPPPSPAPPNNVLNTGIQQ